MPITSYKFKDNQILYRWTNCVSNFTIPIKVTLNGKEKWLKPKTELSVYPLKSKDLKLEVNPDFYVNVIKSNG